ncbi:unnamed protein product [Cyclocybe aegerita]|uniref:Small nuclear ribonucleoprotein Sm D3 n=1 Tax=Cyclocybe aegerita TaxID=1973307 RepID=A0A8S0W450_CYCAE|nr:unnamed protein product [Cyclocybe aegerita]
MASQGLGVPVKLLHESLGHIITVELKTGQLYRGKLAEAEDNLNISLRDITVTGRDGRVSQLDQVYIRGSMIRFFINHPSVFGYYEGWAVAVAVVQESGTECDERAGYRYSARTCDYHASTPWARSCASRQRHSTIAGDSRWDFSQDVQISDTLEF